MAQIQDLLILIFTRKQIEFKNDNMLRIDVKIVLPFQNENHNNLLSCKYSITLAIIDSRTASRHDEPLDTKQPGTLMKEIIEVSLDFARKG